jgi:methyl-accepting chemotaxis protein
MVYAIGTDRNGYVPTHNKRFPALTGDYDKDFVGNRSKRIFDDPVGKQCGKHEMPFLIQTYGGIRARSCTTSRPRFM